MKSLKKKFKDKKFAAGCSRDVIKFGAQLLEWDLDKLFEQTIIAMRSCEDGVKSDRKHSILNYNHNIDTENLIWYN